jgi:tetratricopeptide (TPR) repeat protein
LAAAQTPEELDTHAERVMIRGLAWLQNGYADRAIAVLSEGLKVHSDNPALLGAMARAQTEWGDLGTARFYLDQALAQAPDQNELVSQDLDLALASGDPEAARKAVDRILALDAMEPALLLRHLTDLLDRGPTELSERMASRSMAWFPDNLAILSAAVATLEKTGNLDEAAAAAARIADLTGAWDDAILLARLQMQLGRWPEAAETLLPLVTLDPEDAEARAMWTDLDRRIPGRSLLAEAGLPESGVVVAPAADSLGILRAAWMANPEDEAPTVQLIRFLLAHGQEREAALLAAEHVDTAPRHLEVWVLGARAWMAAGNSAEAIELAETARLLFPGFPPVELVHVEALAAAGRTEEALQQLDAWLARWDASSAEHGEARALQARLRQVP